MAKFRPVSTTTPKKHREIDGLAGGLNGGGRGGGGHLISARRINGADLVNLTRRNRRRRPAMFLEGDQSRNQSPRRRISKSVDGRETTAHHMRRDCIIDRPTTIGSLEGISISRGAPRRPSKLQPDLTAGTPR